MTENPPEAAEAAVEAPQAEDAPLTDAELAEAVDGQLGASEALVVRDVTDHHEGLVAMDAHDVELLVADITRQAQKAALRKWVYELPDSRKSKGLSVHGVQDIVQRMNWTGKCQIGVLPGTLSVEIEEHDTEDGPQKFYVATIFAEDRVVGSALPGVSMEPVQMKLKASVADAKRRDGKPIPESNRVFDVFARTKAVQKATRNALGAFIPEEVEQTVIAMASKKPELVERIQTEAEARVADFPPPLDTPEAKKLTAELEDLYAGIRELGGGQGKLRLPPGQYAAYLLQAQHDMTLLERMRDWLLTRKAEIEAEFA